LTLDAKRIAETDMQMEIRRNPEACCKMILSFQSYGEIPKIFNGVPNFQPDDRPDFLRRMGI
jgi:hypothetical protein